MNTSPRKHLFDIILIGALLAASGVIVYLNREVHRLQATIEAGGGDVVLGSNLLPLKATVAGGTTTIEAGRPRVVLYVAAGCGACARAMPRFRDIVARVGAVNTVLLGPGNREESIKELQQYAQRQKLDGVAVAGISHDTMTEKRMLGVPRVLLVDRGGRIARVWQRVPVTSEEVVDAFRSL